MHLSTQFMEQTLQKDIARLDALVADAPKSRDLRSKCARAYLKALLRDKQETLALLRYRRTSLPS